MQGRPSINNPGYCEASPEYLAAIMGIAKRNYFAFCKRMELLGLADRHPKSRKMRVTIKAYDLICGTGDESSPKNNISDETSPETTKTVTNHHQNGDETSLHYNIDYNTDKNYNTDKEENAQSDFQNPSLTLKEEKKEKKDAPAPRAAKPQKERTGRKNHDFSQALALVRQKSERAYIFFIAVPSIWERVIRYRIEINSIYASAESESIAMIKFWKDAEDNAENAESMIDNTIANSYKGFFPAKKKTQARQNSVKENHEDLARTVMANRKYYPPIEI